MISVSIVNVTSYTGLELLRLLACHPQFEVVSVTARSAVGQRLCDVFPQLRALTASSSVHPEMVITEKPARTDLAFVCLPHAAAAEAVLELVQQGTKVVDLSADFRLHDVAVYEQWYKHVHPAPQMLETAVFGLCERYREQIAQASIVANPGCYATTAILALLPAFAAGIVEPDVVVDGKSGISGAGRSPKQNTHYSEANEDISAYGLDGHRHQPEIVQELIAGAEAGGHPLANGLRLTFIPHLVPMTRGILATCYASLKPEAFERYASKEALRELYTEYYADEPFVHVVDTPPHTKWSYGSNHCFIYPVVDKQAQRLIVVSCLDNLMKGASSQAVQNANRLFGLSETTGLAGIGVYP
ncbi:N-acetyl-gamma-glutamyl-phosphate reductase [Thermosporothrix hazakensis]|jgi:N-acetyl-gamma-glutamyl-phosphate reductase|uniref:N-acetyl-gamma-glutamyl-phosphate reductase n=2 Tax=Thermosporothrix TaxID=768650 RepID=A0A326UA31_THEHA|nr:N-acetyl-gamma-glutamyl-phosphate reductase [Thermosporothrix hazakensis]PZW32063.1 N-acetyl-gamma-glutamyl-phosphate reductase [Thermosporothrix hazakensis]BBH91464.1 N-acetyl-gamma-glutamyl-phosphate reductase [Thermosporothrix sp. COM3]GCE49609.1 N-acetyl-gamma-glutamyl-phosphate reductase [Thermosporothrix hazakensis]